MKRGTRILLVLIILIVVLAVIAFFVVSTGGGLLSSSTGPAAEMTNIVILSQPVAMDSEITAEVLGTMPYPKDNMNPSMIIDKNMVIGKYAKFQLGGGLPLTLDMLQDRPGMAQTGSQAAKTISPGLVAVSIPVSQLSSVAYGIKDGDKVNLIITTNFYDVDTEFQSKLPNDTSTVVDPNAETATGSSDGSTTNVQVQSSGLVASASTSGWGSRQGRAELDNALNEPFYVVPGEAQRPRTVSQMLLQDIQVLHVGDFDTNGTQQVAVIEGQPTPTPAPSFLPNVITIMVSPQEAIVLTYLMNINASFNLVLRAPDDTTRIETNAATLQYLLSQYQIPVPPKLPYIIDNLPYMQNP